MKIIARIKHALDPHREQRIAHNHRVDFFGKGVRPAQPWVQTRHAKRMYDATDDETNNNGKVRFKRIPVEYVGITPANTKFKVDFYDAVCGHYAIMDAFLRTYRQGPMRTERPRFFKDPELIEVLLSANPHMAYKVMTALEQNAPVRHWVAPQHKTNFFAEQLRALRIPEPGKTYTNIFYLSTVNHLMNVTFKVKNVAGKIRYSISVYDPNMTYNHQKIRFLNPDEAFGLSFGDFFDDTQINHYNDPVTEDPYGISNCYVTTNPENYWSLYPIKPSYSDILFWCKSTEQRTITKWNSETPRGDKYTTNATELNKWFLDHNADVRARIKAIEEQNELKKQKKMPLSNPV